MEASLQGTGNIPNSSSAQETFHHPFDITLVVKDGKEFKAHRWVLSEASPFFEKLFNNDMKESKKGVVRLEMPTELVMGDILHFIYTGGIQITAEDNAQDLIVMADFLVLPLLKIKAEKFLAEKLNASRVISTYYFAQKYNCEELTASSKNFIFANFTAVAGKEEFLNLTSEEVKIWISSDEINVSAEEDVFKIILSWIDLDRGERKKYFAELFREVRLVYVSSDYLDSEIMTNDLVNENEECMYLVKGARKFIISDCKKRHDFSVVPRKSLEVPLILVCLYDWNQEKKVLCYSPCEDKWSWFRVRVPPHTMEAFSCRGKIYFISQTKNRLVCYDSFSKCWTSLPYEEQRRLHQLFVGNDGEIYALVSSTDETPCHESFSLQIRGRKPTCDKRLLSFITKYNPESNLWEDVTAFDLDSREGVCVVAKGNLIYCLGGRYPSCGDSYKDECLSNVDRFDLKTNTWHKIADLQESRSDANGAAAGGKIFVIGGFRGKNGIVLDSCEVYHETTNEWHFIANLRMGRGLNCERTVFCADGKLYVVSRDLDVYEPTIIECYDADKNEWNVKTEMPLDLLKMPSWGWWDKEGFYVIYSFCCPMRVFKGCDLFKKASPEKPNNRKCTIM